jgi:hypothetical protein
MAVGIFEDIDDNVFPIIPQLAKKIWALFRKIKNNGI